MAHQVSGIQPLFFIIIRCNKVRQLIYRETIQQICTNWNFFPTVNNRTGRQTSLRKGPFRQSVFAPLTLVQIIVEIRKRRTQCPRNAWDVFLHNYCRWKRVPSNPSHAFVKDLNNIFLMSCVSVSRRQQLAGGGYFQVVDTLACIEASQNKSNYIMHYLRYRWMFAIAYRGRSPVHMCRRVHVCMTPLLAGQIGHLICKIMATISLHQFENLSCIFGLNWKFLIRMSLKSFWRSREKLTVRQ